MSKSKLKSRKRATTKIVKSKIKPKKKIKAKTKSKVKKKINLKSKAKSKSKSKSKSKIKARPKTKNKIPSKKKVLLTIEQKTQLLELIKKITDLRKKTVDGLKSLDAIDHILDPYNQHYTDPNAKFDAIIAFAGIKNAELNSDLGFISHKDTGKDAISLYALLAKVGKGQTQFSEIADKLNAIFEEAHSI